MAIKKKRVSKPKSRKKRVSKLPKPKKRTSRKPSSRKPKTVARPAAPPAPVGKHSIDFDDMDAVREEMARALDVPANSLEIEDFPHSISGTKMYQVEHKGVMGDYGRREDREYYVVENDDAAEEEALARVKQDLENEPEIFNQSFIESHIDTERLRRDLESDVQNMREEDLRDMSARDFWREAEGTGVEPKYVVTGNDPSGTDHNIGEFSDEDDAEEAGRKWVEDHKAADPDPDNADGYDFDVESADPSDSDIETVAEAQAQAQLKDPMQYLEDIYGKEDAVKQAIKIAGIDIDAAAHEAVNVDGAGHFLASYDGDLRESPNGLAYWRHN